MASAAGGVVRVDVKRHVIEHNVTVRLLCGVHPRLVVCLPASQLTHTVVLLQLYEIQVSRGGSTWVVRRRYSEFVEFHKALTRSLKRAHATIALPSLPGTAWRDVAEL